MVSFWLSISAGLLHTVPDSPLLQFMQAQIPHNQLVASLDVLHGILLDAFEQPRLTHWRFLQKLYDVNVFDTYVLSLAMHKRSA